MDVLKKVRAAVYNALKSVYGVDNAFESYPPEVFTGARISLPLVVYSVELGQCRLMAARAPRLIEVTATIDHFAESKKDLSEKSASTNAALFGIFPELISDKHSEPVNGIVRRTQQFRGTLDTVSGIIYLRS